MEIIIIIFFIVTIVTFLYLLFRLLKWIFTNEKRRVLALSLVGFCFITLLINNLFFKKMEFIQSKVYPHLYLIKNPISDKDSLKKIIKAMVIQKMNTEFIGNEEKYKTRYDFAEKEVIELDYGFGFYEYYKGWGSNPIGEAGTAHFIDNKEDPGGFSSEYLEYYRERYQIGGFGIHYCDNDTINYNAILSFSEKGYVVERDTILNLCE